VRRPEHTPGRDGSSPPEGGRHLKLIGHLSAAAAPPHARWAIRLALCSAFGGACCVLHATFAGPALAAADGSDLAANGNKNGAAACSACHGNHGEGRPDAAYPRLDGLDSAYILQQLNDFADRKRNNAIMAPIAKSLSPQERQAVASFYSSQTAAKAPEPKTPDEKFVARGAMLALRGDWPKGLPGCSRCHGPNGEGVGGTFPRLAGQSAEYITQELKAWQQGQRTNDPLHLMTGIATKIDDGEIAAVAAYYASLPPAPALRQGGSK